MPRPWPSCAPSIRPGNIGHHESALIVASTDHAQVRLERGERIIGDLGPGRRDARDQRGFAGVRKADQPDVGQQFQFEAQAFRSSPGLPSSCSVGA